MIETGCTKQTLLHFSTYITGYVERCCVLRPQFGDPYGSMFHVIKPYITVACV